MSRFFCPGRTELAGNHTDHQRGRVMAAAIDRGITAAAEPNGENVIRIFSEGFSPVEIELSRLWPDEKEAGTSAALVRGMAGILSEQLPPLRGFDAHLTSDLPIGTGLSSSAAFSVLVGYMISAFAEGGTASPEDLARAAQKAENRWFGKVCTLTDPMTCALGGTVYMDFLESRILRLNCDFDSLGLALCLTDTGGSQPQPPSSYVAISANMSEIARIFGEPFLAKVRPADFDAVWPKHRDDLKWMRARHFFDETRRVALMADALGLQDGNRYMDLMNESGRSSETLLQNIRTADTGEELTAGLDASARYLGETGAWRVHGSGFTGCVQALMPKELFPQYRISMDAIFGAGSCQPVRIPTRGVCRLDETPEDGEISD